MTVLGGGSTDLGVTVDANVTGFERQIGAAKKSTQGLENALESLDRDIKALERSLDQEAGKALKRHHDALDKAGKAAFAFGAAGAIGFALSAREAVRWESAWAGVTKTVDGTTEEMAVLEDQLRSLAQTLPASHQEIAATAEAAGQLGVQRENVAAFTKVMLDLGNTTNLSAEEAATSLAQFMNVMQSAPDLVDELGNTLVALGNKGASTESQILDLAARLAGVGQTVGASEADVLGLASALANLGIQAELGGGATQRVLLEIFQIMKEGGDKAELLAEISGRSATTFAEKWSNDPVKAFDLFVKGLGRVQDSGGNVIQVLDDLDIKGTQNLAVLLRLAGSGDVLATSLNDSRDAWEQNNALIEEAGKRYETTEAQILMARNQLVDAAIDIGGVVLPVIAGVVDSAGDLIRAWQELPAPLRNAVTVLGLVITAVTLAGGAALIAIPKIAAFKAAVDGLNAGATKSAGKGVIGLASFLTGPWGLALGAATLGLGAFAAKQGDAAREVDALKATLDEQTGALSANSTEWAIKKLRDEGALDAAERLGLNLGMVTDAALGNKDAIAGVNAALDEYLSQVDEVVPKGGPIKTGDKRAAEDLRDVLLDTNGVLAESRRQFEQETTAKDGSKLASDRATPSAANLAAALGDGADAAGDMAEEVKTLGEELSELSEGFLGNRQAGRDVRDTLREIRKATREYIKEHGGLTGAFKDGTRSGDEFEALLDRLATDYQEQISATEAYTGSQKKTLEVYRDARRRLIEVAEQLGMTREQARKYADQLLGTPEMIKTHFEADNAEAKRRVEAYRDLFGQIPRQVVTRFYTIHDDKLDNGGRTPTSTPPSLTGSNLRSPSGPSFSGSRLTSSGAFGGGATTTTLDPSSVQQVAAALAAVQPLYGPVSINGDPTTFRKRMERDRSAAGLEGMGWRSQ